MKYDLLPAIEIGPKKIEDSTAIFQALDQLSSGFSLYPKSLKERTDTVLMEDWSDERLIWIFHYYSLRSTKSKKEFDNNVIRNTYVDRMVTVKLFRLRRAMILKGIGIGDRPEIENRKLFADALAILEGKLSFNPFLTYSEPTASDFACFPILQFMEKAGIQNISDIFDKNQKVVQWMRTMEKLVT